MEAPSALEELKRLREEKLRQITEKRQQIEELRKQKTERIASRVVNTDGMSSIQAKMAEASAKEKYMEESLNKNVVNLIAEIVYQPPTEVKAKPKAKTKSQQQAAADDGEKTKKVSIERPLQELKSLADQASRENAAADRSLKFQEEFGINTLTIETATAESYERACQTDLTGDSLVEQKEKWGGMMDNFAMNMRTASVLKKMAARARDRIIQRRIAGEAAAKEEQEGQGSKEASNEADHNGIPGYRRGVTKRVEAMNTEERELLEAHPDFQAFFQRTTLLVERQLGVQSFQGRAEEIEPAEGEWMRHLENYVEDKLTSSRPVTDVRFSPHHSQLFLASYRERANAALSDVAGCMLVWNLAMKGRPEAAFTCASAVLTAQFHRFEPALFFGGTYSGGIVLWDARAKAGPVMRSPMTRKGHTHPVQAIQQVGTENSANLVTASNDGRLCVWSMAMLNEPTGTIDLRASRGGEGSYQPSFDLAMMSMTFPHQETNIMYAGAEDGSLAQVHIHGQKPGVTGLYDGHEGPITGLHMHPKTGGDILNVQNAASPFDDLLLSSSFDWSVKMWDVKNHRSPILSLDAFEDYVLDVKWHPHHPAVFAAVDGDGYAHLWNLNKSFEAAICKLPNPSLHRRLAMNRCSWSIDGRRLAAGDSDGCVSMYSVDPSLSNPSGEDSVQFKEFVGQLKPLPCAPRPIPEDVRSMSSVDPRGHSSRQSVAATMTLR